MAYSDGANDRAQARLAEHLLQGLADVPAPERARQLEVLIDNRVLNLSRREADLARRLVRPTQPQLLARRLAQVGMGLYASRAYLARRGRPDAPGLEGHDVVGYDEASPPAAESEWLAKWAFRATVVLRTNSARGLLSAAAAGQGLALLPCFVAKDAAGLVQVRPPRGRGDSRSVVARAPRASSRGAHPRADRLSRRRDRRARRGPRRRREGRAVARRRRGRPGSPSRPEPPRGAARPWAGGAGQQRLVSRAKRAGEAARRPLG